MTIDIPSLIEALRVVERITECATEIPVAESGRYVLVRGDRSGVFCGILVSEEGRTVELTECRHIWYWKGAANVAEMALRGVSAPKECKIIAPVARLRVLDAIEIVDCTPEAETSLRAVPVWSKA